MGHISRSALAREIGRSLHDIDRLLAAGLPHTVVGHGRGSEIRIDRAKAMTWLARHALDGGKGNAGARPGPPPEPEFPPAVRTILDGARTDAERGFALGLMTAIYQMPRVVGGMAVHCGAGLTMDQAFEVSRAATLGMVHVLFEDTAKARVEPFASAGEDGPEVIDPEAFACLDWRKVAANVGEPGWRPPMSLPGWVDGADAEAKGDAAVG
jgi:hypothetical protein